MRDDQIEPYLVMGLRSMMFEEAALHYLGVDDIPTFDNSGITRKNALHLGHACNGEQVPHCLKFYQGFFKDFDETKLGESVCIPKCRRKA